MAAVITIDGIDGAASRHRRGQPMRHYASPASINAFGLDEYGNPFGLSEPWGAAIGAASGLVGSSAVKHLAPLTNAQGAINGWQLHAEGVGLGAAALVSGGLMLSHKTRRAGWISLLTAAIANGGRWADDMITHYMLAPAATAPATAPAATSTAATSTAGIGSMMMQQQVPAGGLGAALVQVQQPLGAGPELFQGLAPTFGGLTHQLNGPAPEVINYGSHFGHTAMGGR